MRCGGIEVQKLNKPPKPNSSTWLNLALLPPYCKTPVICCAFFRGIKFAMNKDLFIETIEKIKQQHLHDVKCSELLNQVYSNGFQANLMYENHLLMNQVIKILQVQMNDENGHHSWIEYFMWELDFGIKNDKLKAYRQDNSEIDLSDAGKLYDYLTENIN